MDPNNITLYKRIGLYFIKDQYQKDTFFEYEDAYNHNIDVHKITFKQSDNKCFIRYSDFNQMEIVPLQLRTFTNNDSLMFIHNDDKGLLQTIREIWNKIAELIFINNVPDFVRTTLDDDDDDDDDEFIEADVLKNAALTDDIYDDRLVIVLLSVINDCLQASEMQVVK